MKIDPQLSALGILVSAEDDPPTPEGSDALDKFLQDAELGAKLGPGGHQHAHNLAVELAPLDEAVTAHYCKIASAAAAKTEPATAADSLSLEKRTNGKTTIEETTYPSGRKVIAELEHGVVIRTYAA